LIYVLSKGSVREVGSTRYCSVESEIALELLYIRRFSRFFNVLFGASSPYCDKTKNKFEFKFSHALGGYRADLLTSL